MESKKSLRKKYKEILKGLDVSTRELQESSVIEAVTRSTVWHRAALVLGYLPMPGEFNLKPLLQSALATGKQLALPRVAGKTLTFHTVVSLDGPWVMHHFGMQEPDSALERFDLATADGVNVLVLVPGLVFDPDGYRIGYGGGYYDRLLSLLPESVSSASLLFREQLSDCLPREEHDIRVQHLFCQSKNSKKRPLDP